MRTWYDWMQLKMEVKKKEKEKNVNDVAKKWQRARIKFQESYVNTWSKHFTFQSWISRKVRIPTVNRVSRGFISPKASTSLHHCGPFLLVLSDRIWIVKSTSSSPPSPSVVLNALVLHKLKTCFCTEMTWPRVNVCVYRDLYEQQ